MSRRDLRFVPSISRSGGIDKGGDALAARSLQQEYWAMIDEKTEGYHRQYPMRSMNQASNPKTQIEMEQSILISLRKLREGILASKRADAFAIQVYERSALLCVIFNESHQASPIFGHLVSTLYDPRRPSTVSPRSRQDSIISPRLFAFYFMHLLEILLSSWPSQSNFHNALRHSPLNTSPRTTATKSYLITLSTALRQHNYPKVHSLTRIQQQRQDMDPHLSSALAECNISLPSSNQLHIQSLIYRATRVLFHNLRARVRLHAWSVFRSAYREINIGVLSSARWLEQWLLLDAPETDGEHEMNKEEDQTAVVLRWLEDRAQEGEAVKKDGQSDTRWTLYRDKS